MAITLVQHAQNYTNSGASVTVTLSPTGAGNCLVVCIGLNTEGGTAQTVSTVKLGGAAGNFASLVSNPQTANDSGSYIWADPSCAGAQTSLVVTMSASVAFIGVDVYEVSGLAGTIAALLDQSSSSTASGSNTWSSGATPTTTQPNEFWVGVCGVESGSVNPAGPSSPWTNEAAQDSVSVSGAEISGYQITTSTGAATYSGTVTDGSSAVSVVTLFGAAGGGPVLPYTGGQVYQSQRRKRSQQVLGGIQTVSTTGSFALAPLAFAGNVLVPVPPVQPYAGGQVWRSQRRKRQQQILGTLPPNAGSLGLAGLGFSGTAHVTPAAAGSFALGALGFSGTAKETDRDSGGLGLGALAFSGTAAVTNPFPAFPLGLKYEVLLNGVWTDITGYVYQRDPNVISRARPDETQAVTPCQMTLTLNNRDGRFSPKNTAGAYYPYLARNVQLRVSITNQTSSSTGVTYTGYRFWGEVSTWPPQWDPSQSDIYCQITASGILRRYQQSKALGSPLYQYWTTRPSGADPLIYYPMEDAGFLSSADAQAFTAGYIAPRVTNSADPLIQAMAVSGTPEFATSTVLGGSAALPYIEAATVTSGDLTVSPTPAQLNVVFVMVADPNAADDVAIITINPNVSPASGLDQVVLLYRDAASVISLELIGYSAGPVTLFDSGSVSTPSVGNGLPVVLCVSITATAVTLYATYPQLISGELMPTPVTTVYTHAATTNFTSATGGFTISPPGNSAVGHVAVCDFFPDLLGISAAASGYVGEPALVRFDRLCAERGITTPTRTDYATVVSGYSPSALWKLSDAYGASTILNTATGHSDTISTAFPGIVASPVITVTSGTTVMAPCMSDLTALTNINPSGLGAVTVMAWVNLNVLPGAGPGSTDAHIVANDHTTSSHKGFSLLLSGGQTPQIQFGNGAASGTVTSSNTVTTWGWCMLAATWDGTTITLYVNGQSQGTASLSGTLAGGTDDVAIGYNPVIGSGSSAFGGLLSQVAIIPSALTAAEINGLWQLNAGAQMGPQASDTLLNLLQAVENLDRGQIYEPRTFLGLDYRTRVQLQNQVAALTLDYSASELSPPLQPVEDDQLSRNDVTLTQTGGSSFTVTLPSGTMSTQDPPDGIGDYAYPLTVNAYTAAQLPACAGWIVTAGTVDEYRYPVIPVDLARSELANLFAAVAELDVGQYVQITNPPAFVDSAANDLLAWGFTETLGPFGIWTIAVNGVPGTPYQGGNLPTW